MADHIKLFVYESDIRHTKRENKNQKQKKVVYFTTHHLNNIQNKKYLMKNQPVFHLILFMIILLKCFFSFALNHEEWKDFEAFAEFCAKNFSHENLKYLEKLLHYIYMNKKRQKPLHIESLNFRNCFPTIVQKTPSLKISICKKKNENSFMLYASTPISLNSEKNFFSVIVFEGILGKWGFLENKKSFE